MFCRVDRNGYTAEGASPFENFLIFYLNSFVYARVYAQNLRENHRSADGRKLNVDDRQNNM